MSFWKDCTAIALLAAMAIGISSCGRSDDGGIEADGRIRITFLTMQLQPTFNEFFNGMIAEYEAQNPHVRIVWRDDPFENYETKLTTAFVSRTAPDVINLSAESVPSYITGGYIQPFDQFLDDETFDAFVPNLLQDGGTIDGQVYALPWYVATSITYVNMGIVREAGLTEDDVPRHYEDVPEFARTIRERTGKFALFPLYTESAYMNQHLTNAGVDLFNEDRTRAVFNTPRGVEVFDFWTGLYRDNLVPSEALTATHRRMIELFKAGQLAMLSTGPQFIGQIREDSPDVYRNVMIRPELHWNDAKRHSVALHTLVLSNQSRHAQEAANFAAFITNAQNQLAFSQLVTILPSVTEALDDPYFQEDDGSLELQARRYSAEQVADGGYVFVPPPDFRRMYTAMERATEQVAQGRQEAGAAVAEVERRWNELLGN